MDIVFSLVFSGLAWVIGELLSALAFGIICAGIVKLAIFTIGILKGILKYIKNKISL